MQEQRDASGTNKNKNKQTKKKRFNFLVDYGIKNNRGNLFAKKIHFKYFLILTETKTKSAQSIRIFFYFFPSKNRKETKNLLEKIRNKKQK